MRSARVGLGAAVWLCLAGYVAGVYACVVLVGGLGAVRSDSAGSGQFSGRGDIMLLVLATVLVAVTIEPVGRALRRLLRRTRWFGIGSPYEVLTSFAAGTAAVAGPQDVVSQLVRVVGEGTGARKVSVWLTVDAAARRVAHWPGDDPAPPHWPSPSPLNGERDDSERDDGWKVVPVRHAGQPLGAFVLRFDGRAASPVEERLVCDLAAHAGVVLRNARLTEELTGRLHDLSDQAEALRSSRRRIVAAQDAQRRRLERDIHDGAQQHLVALAVQLRLARVVLGKDPERAAELIAALRPAVADARATLVNLARGIYPSRLAEDGLPAALAAQTAAAPMPVTVLAHDVGRYPPEIEAAVYFCALEALQNAAKHAGATSVTVTITGSDDAVAFTVRDDGRGFEPSRVAAGSGLSTMTDRIETVGGTLEVTSSPAGTTVIGRLPAPRQTPPPAPTPTPAAAPTAGPA